MAAVLALGLPAAAAPQAMNADGLDACALLTPVQIQSVLGRPAGSGVRRDAGEGADGAYSSTCVWLLAGEGGAAPPPGPLDLRGQSFVMLNVLHWPAGSAGARSYLQGFHDARAAGVLGAELIQRDVGDASLWWGDGLAVVRGETSFGVSVRLLPQRARAPAVVEERLALRILERIDRGAAGPRNP